MRECRVGVWPGVDAGAGGGEVLPPPALGEQAQDGRDHDQHEEQAGDRDADGEVALGEADAGRVVRARRLKRSTIISQHNYLIT